MLYIRLCIISGKYKTVQLSVRFESGFRFNSQYSKEFSGIFWESTVFNC